MGSYKVINRDDWCRREHYDFYSKFDNPCYNISTVIKARVINDYCMDNNISLFKLTLFVIMKSANSTPQLRQRRLGKEIIEYSSINVMTPIMKPNETFQQVLCKNTSNFFSFTNQLDMEIEQAKSENKNGPMEIDGENFFCASCLPWVHFSTITHAELKFNSAVPTLTWGMIKNGMIPISCKFNHAFVDGLHASRFFLEIQHNFNNPESIIMLNDS